MSYTKDSVKSPSYLDTWIFDFSSHHLTWTLGYLTSQILPGHLDILLFQVAILPGHWDI